MTFEMSDRVRQLFEHLHQFTKNGDLGLVWKINYRSLFGISSEELTFIRLSVTTSATKILSIAFIKCSGPSMRVDVNS